MKVVFLTLDQVSALHADQIERYGGRTPSATFEGRFLREGFHEIAAAYLCHTVRNHPFVDGNKRVGLMALLAFLGLNARRLDATPRDVEDLVRGIASSQVSKAETAVFVQRHLRSRS